jgi:hypothetical protein
MKKLNYKAIIVWEDQEGYHKETVENIINKYKTDYELKHETMSDEMFIEEFITIHWAWMMVSI